jgi:hypothetical protein
MASMASKMSVALTAFAALVSALLIMASPASGAKKFYDDDPIAREPATEDASGAEEWEIKLIIDLTLNTFTRPGDPTPNVRAQNINTIDEVPDSDWFTNRILHTPLSVDEVVKGPLTSGPPDTTRWSVTRPKKAGAAPGFTARDGRGDLWFLQFDAKGYPEAATGAILVANKIFWALGYWQVENYLVTIRPEQLEIAEDAEMTPPSGKKRPMRMSDLDPVFYHAHKSDDGSYRGIAAKALSGKVIGGFKYDGTRPDDPNDIVPHEHRRELRALKVFGAWANLVDMKADNTLDTNVEENGKIVVRHYLQDVGSTFGTGAKGPHDYDEGWESLYQGDKLAKRLVTVGIYTQPWETVDYDYEENDAIGRFEGKEFDPTTWRPRVPNGAFLRARPDDDFWAARRVMAFSDEMIRAIVKTGGYTDPEAEKHLSNVLIQRRDKIGRAFLLPINPLVNFALSDSLTFENAAVAAGVADEAEAGYSATWFSFDNDTGATTPIGETQATVEPQLPIPAGLSDRPGDFVKVQVAAAQSTNEAWRKPVDVYFRRMDTGWKLVGLERLP